MKIEDVKINGMKNPVGIPVTGDVEVSWTMTGVPADGLMLEQVLVYSDPLCKNQVAIRRDTVLNEDGEAISLKTTPRTRYYVKVQAVSNGKEPAESEVAIFETSKMDEPWRAKWIMADDGVTPSGYLKMFTLSGADDLYPMAEENDPDDGIERIENSEEEMASKGEAGEAAAEDAEASEGAGLTKGAGEAAGSGGNPAARIVSGRLYAAAEAACEILLNGTSVGILPDPQDAGLKESEVGYLTSNVSNLLGDDNLLEILPLDAQGPVAVIAELHVRRADGSESVEATDHSWLYRTSDGGEWKPVHVSTSSRKLVEVPLGEGTDQSEEGTMLGGLRW